MKRNIIIWTLSIVVASSCTQELISTDTGDIVELSRSIIECGYFAFDDNQYKLSISKEEAENLGFSKDAYEYLQTYAYKKNESIRLYLEKKKNFTIYEDKTNSYQVIDQINDMILEGYINSVGDSCYYLNISIEDALDLGYSKEAYETVVQRINDGTIYESSFILPPYQDRQINKGLSTKSYLPMFILGMIKTTLEERRITDYYDISTIPLDILFLTIDVRFHTDSGIGNHNFYAQTTDPYPTSIINGYPGGTNIISVYNGGDNIAISYECTGDLCGTCFFQRIQ